jgi:hypothetical protein
MPTVNATIGYPIIVAPAHFKVRFRVAVPLGLPIWTNLPDQTNAPFSFIAPGFGSYVLGVTYIDTLGDSCEEVLYPFEVTQVCECIFIEAPSILREVPGGPVYINLPYTNPNSADPGCGVLVRFAPANLPVDLTTPATVRLSPMPASPIRVPVQTLIPYRVEVLLDCCDGRVQSCFDGTLPADPEPASGCIAITDTNAIVVVVKSISTGKYYIRIRFPGSPSAVVPSLCPGMYFSANQMGKVQGRPARMDSVTGPLPPSAFFPYRTDGHEVLFPANPTLDVDYIGIRYIVVLHDCCGNVVTFPLAAYNGDLIA